MNVKTFQGPTMADIHGELSPDLRAATQDRLMREAFARVQTQVTAASAAMGLRCTSYSALRIEKDEQAVVRPMSRVRIAGSGIPLGFEV